MANKTLELQDRNSGQSQPETSLNTPGQQNVKSNKRKMQEKLQKIFSYFSSIKNQPFYTSCISQIISIYEHTPESLKFILYNLNHLIFSTCKEPKLRLKHRLICSSLIAKLAKIYTERVKLFIENQSSFELENFQLESKCSAKSEERKSETNWEDLDLLQLIESQQLLFSTVKNRVDNSATDYAEEEKTVFNQFLEMNHATMLNIQNAFKDVQSQNEVTDEAFLQKKLKYKSKIEKYSSKSNPKITEVELTISNPFNLMYQICLDNILHTEWQLRHLAVLILKQLLENALFLGFTHTFTSNKLDSAQARFQFLSQLTKDLLRKHVKQAQRNKTIIDEVITRILPLLCLDRFADYQTDESMIIVRMVGAKILATCFLCLSSQRQTVMIRLLKRIFDKDCQMSQSTSKDKFTWQVKHSFLVFLGYLLEEKQHSKMVCSFLQQSLIKMLGNDQIDQITLYVCKIIESFLGEQFFDNDKIDRVNRQVWAVVENMDDISISAKETLKLLWKLFPYFKLNQGACMERLRKFFTSKISEVRVQLYKLNVCLLCKKKEISDPKIIEKTLIQFFQAVVIEHEKENFNELLPIAPHVVHYTRKFKNLRKIVEFINACVTPNQYTEEIIGNKFILAQTEFGSNDYLTIYQHENLHCPVGLYTDKRSWKVALALAEGFKSTQQGLEQVVRGIEKNNQKNHRAKILLLVLMIELLTHCPTKAKIYEEYKQIATKMLTIEFYDILDCQIVKVYIPEFLLRLKNLLEGEGEKQLAIRAKAENTESIGVLKDISNTLKKTDLNNKHEVEIGRKLKAIFESSSDQDLVLQVQYLLSLLDSIMQSQRQLARHIRLLSACYLVKYEKEEITNLNNIIKPIHECIREDSYSFISQYTAIAAEGLSLSLYKNKKTIFKKFNVHLLAKVANSYTAAKIYIPQAEGSLKLIAQHMEGVCSYISSIGKAIPNFLDEFTQCFLEEEKDQEKPNEYSLEEQYVRLLTLLSGTVCSALSVDHSNNFTSKLSTKLTQMLSRSDQAHSQWSLIASQIKRVLCDSMAYLSVHYNEQSNIFFRWYLSQMAQGSEIFFQVLEQVCETHIVSIAPICSLFILQIIKTISKVHLHNYAMNSLSNLIVGVYTNVKAIPMTPDLLLLSEEGVEFIKNFKNTDNFRYELQVQLKPEIQLRSYQIEGINWLGFLTKYNLNGALCDDMGLGKTLQVLIMIDNEYHRRSEGCDLDTLIVAPSTLMEHWAFEHAKYFKNPSCNVKIVPNRKSMEKLCTQRRVQGQKPKIYITNYSALEKAIGLKELSFNFVILDEGHVIKNVKTNKFQAVKSLRCQHRFILTGTPIQNRLIELWGLFDFLMPGYLYQEDVFRKHYEKLFEVNLTTFKEDELLFSQEQKSVLEKLHFKVMPFIMRRMKCDVLRELPDKIINDYYCTMTEEQTCLYSKFTKQKLLGRGNQDKHEMKEKEQSTLVNLHEMIKIVNHPILTSEMKKGNCVWEHSGKFIALGELFEQFGFTEEDSLLQNKVIIFAKQKTTVDLIQSYITEVHSQVKFLKLTSDIKIGDRFSVAQTFNGDSNIKALVVTKSIGGEGLNLSSANFVVMFDSDYNPTVDMQAIDRAHRIGQKKVLNVFRLITKDTLEQKIMGIQKFKTNLANAIVNIDNASIKNVVESKLPSLLENVRDLQLASKDYQSKINHSLHQAMLAEFERDAIQTEQFIRKY